ncbi:MAG: proton-conducting transporter membrane subunit, partial [Armatimonadota bacterium]
LAAGAVEQSTGSQRLPQPRNLRALMPVTSGAFLLGALTLSGWPPLAGFWGKLSIVFGAAEQRAWLALAVLLVTALQRREVVSETESVFADAAEQHPGRTPPGVAALMLIMALLCAAFSAVPWLVQEAARAAIGF